MSRFTIFLIVSILVFAQIAWINPLRDRVKEANQSFYDGDYEKAIQLYTDIAATYAPESRELHFNIGSSWFRQDKYEKAIEEFHHVIGSNDEKFDAKALYNIGNAHFRMEDYAKAIEYYVQSLKLNPEDEDTKYNLEVARRKLKEQIDENKQNQQQDQQENQQNQDQQQEPQEGEQKDDQSQEEQSQSQQQQDEDQKQEQQGQNQQEQEKQQQEQPGQQNQQPGELTEEEAKQILDNMEAAEKEQRRDFQRRQQSSGSPQKGW